ncbi:MAG: DNA repair protein RecN [Clostridia bacterium]|nr:DNA repair protein RecN [Clostridia bacterium]
MLKELHIKNVAVIDEVHIEFSPGFNVLTGETGAGKSILIDSIGMAIGRRTSHELIRSGCDAAVVSACFFVSSEEILEKMSDMGIECDDGVVLINRKITADGKSLCHINGVAMPQGLVREISAMLIDIHGQSDNHSLLDEKKHLTLLDEFGGANESLESYKNIFKKMKELSKEKERLSASKDEKVRRMELLEFQIDEIDNAKLKSGEDESLEERREYLYNMESITKGAGAAYGALYGGEETSAYDLLKRAQRSIQEISRFLPKLEACSNRLDGIIADTDDIASEINEYISGTEFSMAELDFIEERLDTINNLKRKYGNSIEEILEYCEKARTELGTLEKSDERLGEIEKELEKVEEELKTLAENLTAIRLDAAKTLEEQIRNELFELDMPKVRFAIEILDNENESGVSYTENGKDKVRFLLSTNPGEDLKPMTKIASGGELSRIMLAVKSVLSDMGTQDTMIFDEIDTGVSGRAAQKIAEKLSALAKKRQVFSITHLAQIASMADSHFLIQKNSTDSSTKTEVICLDDEGRTDELARIIGGVSVTDLTRSSALEMLDMAKKKKEI